MKPPRFDYFVPNTLDEVLSLLAQFGDDAKILAGGQSLVPAMNFRLAQPAVLIDLNHVSGLAGIREREDSAVVIDAMTRQRAVERSPLVAERAPLLSEAMPHIAHPQIRNRGTFGGSLAHADPASELPAVAVALDAEMHLLSARGERRVEASDFFLGLFTTSIEPDEILVSTSIPLTAPRTGTAFGEIARRHGDYAMAGAATTVTLAQDGTISDSRVIFFSVGDAPVMARHCADALRGQRPTADNFRLAAALVDKDISPIGDIHATVAYRRHLATVLAKRTLTAAAARASSGH